MVVDVLQGLFRDANIRPKTLFRDLQYIAAFVPAQMLDRTPRGKAFWDAGLAALGLKQDVVRQMVVIADKIVEENTKERGSSTQAPSRQQNVESQAEAAANPSGVSPAPAPRYTMEDAARMFLISAKEGDAAAERELAIFYLTSGDVLPPTTMPLFKPRDVFKDEIMSKKRSGDDRLRSDPATMCLAQHWMEMSRKGGDELAASYLKGREEIERIPGAPH
jgi:hypothetical protein